MLVEWKKINNFPDYEINNYGEIRRLTSRQRGRKGNILRPFLRKNGYLQTILHCNGKRKRFLVHSLVAMHFLSPRPSPHHEVAHNDNVRNNNFAGNLQWKTHLENEADKIIHNTILRGSQVGNSVLNETKVAEKKTYWY